MMIAFLYLVIVLNYNFHGSHGWLKLPISSSTSFHLPLAIKPPQRQVYYKNKRIFSLDMRVDGSTASAYFLVGDRVRVTTSVWHRPPTQPMFDSKDFVGELDTLIYTSLSNITNLSYV